MKNPRLDAGRAYLKRAGYDDIPDKVIIDLFGHMICEDEAEYEVGDFVIWNEGMGEVGHGTVLEVLDNAYKVDVYLYPETTYEPYSRRIHKGEVFSLSTIEEADQYFLIRTGKIEPPYPVAKYKGPQ